MIILAGNCWPMKRFIFELFYHTYLDTEKEYENKQQILEMTELALDEFCDFMLNYKKYQFCGGYLKHVKGSYHIESLLDRYIFQILLQIINYSIIKNTLYGKDGLETFFKKFISALGELMQFVESDGKVKYLAKIYIKLLGKQYIYNPLKS